MGNNIPPLPPQALRFMNEDDKRFHEIGKANLDLLKKNGLARHSTLLDVGCGYGRLAYAILNWWYGSWAGGDRYFQDVVIARK